MDKLGFAIVGAGNIGKVHARALSTISQARLVVVCDGDSCAVPLVEEFGGSWIRDYQEAVAQPDVDVVCVCTPSGAHAEIAVAAARAGKHVVVEKPIEISLERALPMIDATKVAGVKLAVIFPTRFKEGPSRARQAVVAGRLGRLTLATAAVNWWRPGAYYANSWRGTLKLDGGGALINQSIHTIDLLRWIVGPVQTVMGWVATLAHHIEGEDTGVAILTFASGALGVIQGATSCWPGEPARLELHGDRGAITLEEGVIVRWKLQDAAPDEEERMLNLEQSQGSGSGDSMDITDLPHRWQLADMVDAILNDRPPMIDGAEGLAALEIIRAIYRSSQTGHPVQLPLQLEQALAPEGERL